MDRSRQVRIAENAEALARAGAVELVRRAEKTLRLREFFSVVLAGGSTPRRLYSLLGDETPLRERVAWEKVHFFFGDERHVPPDHPDSNYRMAYETFLSKLPTSATNIHRFATELEPRAAADRCEEMLRRFFDLAPGELPRFDLVLLGLGRDGHTASLFPGSESVWERSRLAVAPRVEPPGIPRLTLTPPVFNRAAAVLFLVSGSEKAEALQNVLEGEFQPDQFPAQAIQPTNGELLWLVDRAAARLLRPAG